MTCPYERFFLLLTGTGTSSTGTPQGCDTSQFWPVVLVGIHAFSIEVSLMDLCDGQNNINPNILMTFQTDVEENSIAKNLVLG